MQARKPMRLTNSEDGGTPKHVWHGGCVTSDMEPGVLADGKRIMSPCAAHARRGRMRVFVALAASACSPITPLRGPPPATGVPAWRAPSPAPATPSDEEISTGVRTSLERDPGVDRANIRVKTTEGIVELTGSVGDLLSKQRAVRVAELVKGVRAVSDQLGLVLIERSDPDVASDVRHALQTDASTASLKITSTVDRETVTLSGQVNMYQERKMAERLAEGVKGVRDVNNEIRVQLGSRPDDPEIAANVRSRLRWDMLVEDRLLSVSVHDGQVTLAGSVGNAAERRRAAVDSWVWGVRFVDDSLVRVPRHPAKHDFIRREAAASDTEIQDAVLDVLAYDPRVSAADVRVAVQGGFVTLRGSVGTPRAKAIAEALAKQTMGVIQVINELAVTPIARVPDAVIQSYARHSIDYDPYLNRFDIGVRADHGTVTLTGTVDTTFDRAQATDLVGRLQGVKNVDNDVVVRRPEVGHVHDPLLDPYDPYGETWRYPPEVGPRADAEIERDIRSKLDQNPLVHAADIHLTVRNGDAILRGTVGSFAETQLAAETAFQGGARTVRNELEIRH